MNRSAPLVCCLVIALHGSGSLVSAQQGKNAQPAKNKAGEKGKNSGKGPQRPQSVGPVVRENKATPIDRIKVAKDFKVELVYSVPGGDQGSWVNLCVDPQGRIIASDQYGGLYRFPRPEAGKPLDPKSVQKLPLDIRAVNGMVWAFDALYLGVNDYEKKIPSGLYRATDSNGDGELDKVECLRELDASGDHGVHAVVPTPDGKALYLVCGNSTKRTDTIASSKVPVVWGEDHLLPRMPDGRGFMRDVLGPGGIIYRVTPDGKDFDMVACGFRNIFDASVNRAGDLFTYDADMEYDFNTSWYRPTRVCQVTSGAEYGWRNGAGKRPEFYADNLPPVVNIGPGSPTGTTFGYGAKFPAKYQEALYVLDWSWGKIYAVHMQPSGATYTAVKEEFMSGAPLPVTDAIIHPLDGAMYFTIGGRRVQSGLYRVTYTGSESTDIVKPQLAVTPEAQTRQALEKFHGKHDPAAIDAAWPHLSSGDRFLRWAARTALEHQPVATWSARALAEREPGKQVEALLGLARAGGICPQHRAKMESSPPVDTALGAKLHEALVKIDWSQLTAEQRLTYVRTVEIALNRFGRPDEAVASALIAKLDAQFPGESFELNWLLCETLSFLQAPNLATKAMALIEQAPTQEEQIEYARSLRMLKAGWTTDTRTAYFKWFLKAANYRGGASFEKFIEFIRSDAVASLSDAEKEQFKTLLDEKPVRKSPIEAIGAMFAGRTPTNWTLDELVAIAATDLKHRNFAQGRKLFGAGGCFACHRFGNEGGSTGPDLTAAGRRFSTRDLLDQIVHPSKVINEQFVPLEVITVDDELIRGVLVNLAGDTIQLNTDGTDPNQRRAVDRKEVVSIGLSKISPMPEKLLNPLTRDEIMDLLAYLISGGDPKHTLFQK
ncbi:MAG: c-type cytochrome [Planctomycetaceae bacterium]|nr:c-type cytochrome [Planctomycetaceae bacterium]